MSDETDESLVKKNPLESWEDGAAFGVAQEKDPVCKVPVEEWIKKVEITSTADVPIPEKLVDQVIGQEAASIVVRKAAEQKKTCNYGWRTRYWKVNVSTFNDRIPS